MIIDIETKKSRKLCQELIDSTFLYMRYHNNPNLDSTPFKQTTSKKRLLKALNSMIEFLDRGKVIEYKPKVTSYKVTGKEFKHVTIIEP